MHVQHITLRELALPLKTPFKTSFATLTDRRVILIELVDDAGVRGFGEAAPITPPFYTEESFHTAWHMLVDYLIPLTLNKPWRTPEQLSDVLRIVQRNYAAKAGLEGAAWDAWAKRRNVSLADLLQGTRPEIPSGIALGIPDSTDELLRQVHQALEAGYKRIKIKIQPGWDIEPLRAIRRRFKNIPLSVDANAAYTLEDEDHLKKLDDFGLDMIEQPLDREDLVDHAKLQSRFKTSICLDESISSATSARQALQLGSCRIVNIKISRVGGITEAKRIHDVCHARNVPVWCGGMLETGIGRAHALALASLPNFSLPADLSPSARYYDRDIVASDIAFSKPGFIAVPDGPGIGVQLSEEALQAFTVKTKVIRRRPTHRSSNEMSNS